MEQGRHILLIRRERHTLWEQTLSEALAPLGYLERVNEQEALHKFKENSYDLVIVDALDVSDAISITKQLRQAKPDTRVIIASDLRTWRLAREAFRAGAADYITKSLDKFKLLSQIEAVLKAPPPPLFADDRR
ncbi:MAG: response regulator [Anaerolineales bacterium]|jgi:DNA-binding response OmpR family regulator